MGCREAVGCRQQQCWYKGRYLRLEEEGNWVAYAADRFQVAASMLRETCWRAHRAGHAAHLGSTSSPRHGRAARRRHADRRVHPPFRADPAAGLPRSSAAVPSSPRRRASHRACQTAMVIVLGRAVTASNNRFSGGGNCVALPAGGASLGPDVARRNVTIRHRPGSAMATSPLSIRTPRDWRISSAEKRIPAWRRRHRSCSLDSPAG